ncbi:expressed unknown protein [Seminavis robusta]|uniref:Uncharacterized protein n=1 Tax=Seminavis robusta TaxID=568900 RepID=A0A9N8D976_9STRA|nr:expressed unknown protein [Seminavis robusta]|eukprot:Sro3_g002250.1 n/a (271) ;mRNA; f:99324-100253
MEEGSGGPGNGGGEEDNVVFLGEQGDVEDYLEEKYNDFVTLNEKAQEKWISVERNRDMAPSEVHAICKFVMNACQQINAAFEGVLESLKQSKEELELEREDDGPDTQATLKNWTNGAFIFLFKADAEIHDLGWSVKNREKLKELERKKAPIRDNFALWQRQLEVMQTIALMEETIIKVDTQMDEYRLWFATAYRRLQRSEHQERGRESEEDVYSIVAGDDSDEDETNLEILVARTNRFPGSDYLRRIRRMDRWREATTPLRKKQFFPKWH